MFCHVRIRILNSYRYRGMERVPTLYSELEDIVKKYPNSLIGTNACIGGQIGSLVLNLVEAETKGELNKIYDYKSKIDSFIKWCKQYLPLRKIIGFLSRITVIGSCLFPVFFINKG